MKIGTDLRLPDLGRNRKMMSTLIHDIFVRFVPWMDSHLVAVNILRSSCDALKAKPHHARQWDNEKDHVALKHVIGNIFIPRVPLGYSCQVAIKRYDYGGLKTTLF